MQLMYAKMLRIFKRLFVASDIYLPKLNRRWAGLLIVAPIKEVLDQVEEKFREQQMEEFSKVFTLLILICYT